MLPFYKSLDIPNLAAISEQIDRALPELVTGKFNLKEVYSFNLIDVESLKKLSPALTQWLTDVELNNHLLYAGLPWTAPSSKGSIHSDGKCIEAINLPIYNCDQGWMIWYDAEQMGGVNHMPSGNSTKNQLAEYVPYKHSGATELARISSSQAAWVNTQIPHQGINLSNRPRIILTLRFDVPINLEKLISFNV